MAVPLFVAGFNLGVTFKPSGAGIFTAINITAWDWAEKVVKLVTTHTGSAGIAWWLAGVLDGNGRVQANFDLNNMNQLNPPSIIAGQGGLITCSVGSANPFSIPVRIEEVHYQSAVLDLMKYDFSISMDGSQTAGSYTRPS